MLHQTSIWESRVGKEWHFIVALVCGSHRSNENGVELTNLPRSMDLITTYGAAYNRLTGFF